MHLQKYGKCESSIERRRAGGHLMRDWVFLTSASRRDRREYWVQCDEAMFSLLEMIRGIQKIKPYIRLDKKIGIEENRSNEPHHGPHDTKVLDILRDLCQIDIT